jgi:hypothetical protein
VRPVPAPTGLLPRARRSLSQTLPWVRKAARGLVAGACAREQRILVLPLVVLSIVSGVSTVASPWLGQWPLLLALLAPRLPFLVLAAPVTPLPIFLVLGTARLCVADPFHFLLGRRLGDHIHGSGRIQRLVDRFGTPATFVAILLRPIGRHLFVAGATSSSPMTVALADIASTAVFLLAVAGGASLLN